MDGRRTAVILLIEKYSHSHEGIEPPGDVDDAALVENEIVSNKKTKKGEIEHTAILPCHLLVL